MATVTVNVPSADADAFVDAELAARAAGVDLMDDLHAFIVQYPNREDIKGKALHVLPSDRVFCSDADVDAFFTEVLNND